MIVDVRIIKYIFIVIFLFKLAYREYIRTQAPRSKNPVCYPSTQQLHFNSIEYIYRKTQIRLQTLMKLVGQAKYPSI